MATKRRPAPVRPTLSGLVPTDTSPGRDVEIGTFIVEQIRAGVDPINAAGTVGVTSAEFMAWMREGALVFSRLGNGANWRKDFTPYQQDCAIFADQTLRAHATHISRLSLIAEQAARGTLPEKITTRRKSVNGVIVEEHVTTERIAPDTDMLRWKLEKLEPQVYGNKATLNVTVVDMTDTDATADLVGDRMREIARTLAIEATSSEEPREDPDPSPPTTPAV